MDKLIDEIIELVLEDMDCHHEWTHDEDGAHEFHEYNLTDETKLREKIGELIEQSKERIQRIGKDWLPTIENINLLPEPVRNYIADIGTNADPPSMVADNIIMKDTIKALEKMLEVLPEITDIWTDGKAKEIKALVEQAQDENLEDPVTSLHYLGLSLDIVTSIIDDLRPDKKPEIDYKFFRPPGRDKKLDAQFVRLLEESKRLGIGEKEFIDGILKEYKKKSEIEVEKK